MLLWKQEGTENLDHKSPQVPEPLPHLSARLQPQKMHSCLRCGKLSLQSQHRTLRWSQEGRCLGGLVFSESGLSATKNLLSGPWLLNVKGCCIFVANRYYFG